MWSLFREVDSDAEKNYQPLGKNEKQCSHHLRSRYSNKWSNARPKNETIVVQVQNQQLPSVANNFQGTSCNSCTLSWCTQQQTVQSFIKIPLPIACLSYSIVSCYLQIQCKWHHTLESIPCNTSYFRLVWCAVDLLHPAFYCALLQVGLSNTFFKDNAKNHEYESIAWW